jgi:hypothetical protein
VAKGVGMVNLGYKTYTTAEEIVEAEKEFVRLRKEGHAIVFWENFEHEGKLLDANSLHYLSCKICIEQRSQNEKGNEKNKANKNSNAV